MKDRLLAFASKENCLAFELPVHCWVFEIWKALSDLLILQLERSLTLLALD